MKLWIQKHQKSISMAGGLFFVLLTLLIFFWDRQKDAVINEKALIKSSEQHYTTHSSNIIKRQPKNDLSNLTAALHERQKEQSRIFLLVMLILGLGLMLYSFLQPSKKRDV